MTIASGRDDEETMRIPPWTPAAAPRDPALLEAILERRGGKFINLDLALLWSEPLARGWNAYVGAVRNELSVSPRLKELAICVVARITGAAYEFKHHWPVYVKSGGRDELRGRLDDPDRAAADPEFSDDERLAIRYAIAMTRDVKIAPALFEEVRKRFRRPKKKARHEPRLKPGSHGYPGGRTS
jgi:alkylhydroperoxidase family enzyme